MRVVLVAAVAIARLVVITIQPGATSSRGRHRGDGNHGGPAALATAPLLRLLCASSLNTVTTSLRRLSLQRRMARL